MNKAQDTLPPTQKRMLSIKEAAGYLGIGITAARAYAEQVGAVWHAGARVLVDRMVLDRALDAKEEMRW